MLLREKSRCFWRQRPICNQHVCAIALELRHLQGLFLCVAIVVKSKWSVKLKFIHIVLKHHSSSKFGEIIKFFAEKLGRKLQVKSTQY